MKSRTIWLLPAFGGAFILSLLVGAAGIGPAEIVRGLLRPEDPSASAVRALVLDLRLPRTILAALVGAALGLSGVLLQAYFQNPMAGPYVVGVSSGAGLAAVAVGLAYGTSSPPPAMVAFAAFAGGILVVAVVAWLARWARSGRTETLLLLGLAVAAVCSAVTSVLLLLLPNGPEGVLFWLLGSLTGADWGGILIVAAALALPLAFAMAITGDLDAILWGDETARSVGVPLDRVRILILVAATIPVAASVALCGVIGFLGLMVPHLARGLVGSTHRRLIPMAVALGAGWLMVADMIARIVLAPAEVPVGAITSAVGAPFLAWICLRRRS